MLSLSLSLYQPLFPSIWDWLNSFTSCCALHMLSINIFFPHLHRIIMIFSPMQSAICWYFFTTISSNLAGHLGNSSAVGAKFNYILIWKNVLQVFALSDLIAINGIGIGNLCRLWWNGFFSCSRETWWVWRGLSCFIEGGYEWFIDTCRYRCMYIEYFKRWKSFGCTKKKILEYSTLTQLIFDEPHISGCETATSLCNENTPRVQLPWQWGG